MVPPTGLLAHLPVPISYFDAIRYRWVADRMKNDWFATAIEASVSPSIALRASGLNSTPGAMTVVTPSSLRK